MKNSLIFFVVVFIIVAGCSSGIKETNNQQTPTITNPTKMVTQNISAFQKDSIIGTWIPVQLPMDQRPAVFFQTDSPLIVTSSANAKWEKCDQGDCSSQELQLRYQEPGIYTYSNYLGDTGYLKMNDLNHMTFGQKMFPNDPTYATIEFVRKA